MDYYKILEVSENADLSEIKKKYKKLAMKYHPDRNPDDSRALKKFKEIVEAYEVIGNSEKRKEYDNSRKGGNNSGNTKDKQYSDTGKFSHSSFSFGKDFFKSANGTKEMFQNTFDFEKMKKKNMEMKNENIGKFENFFDLKRKK